MFRKEPGRWQVSVHSKDLLERKVTHSGQRLLLTGEAKDRVLSVLIDTAVCSTWTHAGLSQAVTPRPFLGSLTTNVACFGRGHHQTHRVSPHSTPGNVLCVPSVTEASLLEREPAKLIDPRAATCQQGLMPPKFCRQVWLFSWKQQGNSEGEGPGRRSAGGTCLACGRTWGFHVLHKEELEHDRVGSVRR